MRNFSVILLIVIGFTAQSCGEKPYYEEFNTVAGKTWKAQEKAQFTIDITDTITTYDFIAHIRTTTDYQYNNLWFIFNLKHPTGIMQTDTIPMAITDNTGKWLGKNTGSLVTTSFALASDQSFKSAGEYIVEIEQVMQDSVLREVTDVGFGLYKSVGQ